MIEQSRKNNKELVTTDLFLLDDKALKNHIYELQDERNRLKNSVVPSVSECNTLIAIAHAELSARSTDRLAKWALFISVASIFFSSLVTVLSIG